MIKSKLLIILSFFLLLSVVVNAKRIIIVGDSTAASYSPKRYPLYGWGQVMVEELKGKIKVINMARSGASSKSYNGGPWNKVKKILQPKDILLIQLGHNDETRGITVEEFKKNLSFYVTESKKQGARPILVSPVCRREFVNDRAFDTHGEYAKAVAETAKTLNVDFIDLTSLSTAWLDKIGAEKSIEYYKSSKDNTHFNQKGATVVYKIILDELKKQNIL